MSFVRIKKVAMDNIEIDVAPLSFAQTEALLAEFKKLLGINEDGSKTENFVIDIKAVDKMWHEAVCNGINRAAGNQNMTPDVLKAQMDKPLIALLQKTVMELSGLELQKGEDAKPGEEKTP